eukprot:TRINITY_DN465_c0_g1_i2.p1 TRINITY_DN465_c0_g1~~TRINITY_DN465_c0_g1_i2.p1  ORF type:complete len:463 (-),score=126.36 TRINITY_DN465_c0_g1_i2:242-1630(-)
MGNGLAANRQTQRPPSYPGPANASSTHRGSRAFFPPENHYSPRHKESRSREESNLPHRDFNLPHPGQLERRISSRPTAPPQSIRANQDTPEDPLPSNLHISQLKQFHKFQKTTPDTTPTHPPAVPHTEHIHTVFNPLQLVQQNKSMEIPNQLAIDNLVDQLVTSDEEQRIAGDVKLQVGIMFQALRRLEQDNAALRRVAGAGGGRGPGPDAMGDIAALQEEIANYQGQVKGLEDKNNELYKVNHEWSEEYKNMRKSLTDQIKKFGEEKGALERQIAKLDADLAEDENATGQLIKKLKNVNAVLTQDKMLLEQQIEELDIEKGKLAKRLTTLEKLYEEDVNEELAAKEQIRDLALTIREMKDKEKKHINEYTVLDDRVTDMQEQLRKAKNQQKAERETREKAEKELKKANRAFKDIKKVYFHSPPRREYFPPPIVNRYDPFDPYAPCDDVYDIDYDPLYDKYW